MSAGVNPFLGLRTHFSLGESILTPGDIVKAVKEAGLTSFAVCDTMNLSSQIELTKKATKEGLKPVVGVRLRIVEELRREKRANNGAVYVKVYPRNETGQRAIYALLSKAFDEDHFYEVPRITWSNLDGIDHNDLIWTTGDIEGVFGSPRHHGLATELVRRVGSDNVFVELVPINTPYFDRCNANAIRAITGLKLRPLVVCPAMYAKDDYEAFLVSMAIQKRSVLSKSFTVYAPHNDDAHPLTLAQLLPRVSAARKRVTDRYDLDGGTVWKDGLTNSSTFLDGCAHVWTKQPISLPVMAEDPDRAVASACTVGMKDRLFKPVNGYQPTADAIRDVYIPRLKYELGVLKDMGFSTYFLVVSDVVNWSKSQGILVGPGRGSVGGSLVAYLMGITDVDPIRFGLLFERFINPSRNDLPDADLDFMSTRRHEVVDYLEKRHGADFVAGISNYGQLGAASAIRDVARVFGHDVMQLTASKFVPKVHGQPVDLETAAKEVPEIRTWADRNPDEWKNALKLEGKMRSYGKHAAGIIVSGSRLDTRGVVERREGARVVNWDMAVAEDAGMVKLDILGLSTLDTLSRCVGYIKERHGGKVLDLNEIQLDDEATLDLFSKGRTQGIFQFEGGAARRILQDMSKKAKLTFDDLVAANALNRPGPIEAGLVKQYVDSKNGDDFIALPHENMKGALEETFNVLCYQEQVMRVSVDLCGFSLSEADKLRKAMGKKDPVLMASYRDLFVSGAEKVSGMKPDLAGEIFDQIEKFAGYAFNKSHAVEYSLISYQMAWLKVHYPVEFFAAALSTVDEGKLPSLVEDATRLGINILPPDVNISTNEFVIANDTTLVIPFNRVKGMSDKAAWAIMVARDQTTYEVEEKVKVGRKTEVTMKAVPCGKRFASIEEFRARVPARSCNVGHIEKLEKVGAFHRIAPGSLPPLHDSRQRDQHELIPGLMSRPVLIGRDIPTDKFAFAEIAAVYRDADANHPKTVIVRPAFGKFAKFVAVFDAPSRGEEQNKQMISTDSFKPVSEAMFDAGMNRSGGYWTSLVKRTKEGSALTPGEVSTYAPYLERELSILKPPLIIALGTNAARYLVPEIKGSIFDYVGKVFYDRKRDCNILIGFTPGMIYHDPDKQETMNELFERAASLL